MKIKNISNYINYNCSSKPVKNEETSKTNKFDVVDIKSRIADKSNSAGVASVKRKIVAEINGETKTDKLMRIKNSIDNNDYHIDVDEIVRKMLV